MSNDILYVLILMPAMTVDGHVYLEGDLIPDPPGGFYDQSEKQGNKDGTVVGYKGNKLFRMVDEKTAKELDKKGEGRIIQKIKTSLHGTLPPGHTAPPVNTVKHSVYTPEGAKEAGLDKPPERASAKAAREAEKTAKAREKAAKDKAEAQDKAKAKAEKDKASKAKKTAKTKKKSPARGRK